MKEQFVYGKKIIRDDAVYYYGKPIDVSRLKVDVLTDVQKKLEDVSGQVKKLAQHFKKVPQKTCYICHEINSIALAEIYGFHYVQCSQCSHVRTSERYALTDLLEFYKNDTYYSGATYANAKSFHYRIENVARPKVAFLESFTNKKGKFIDVGSGIGDIPLVAKENGWDAIGIEISVSSVDFGKKELGSPLLQGDFEKYLESLAVSSIDAVSLIGFLEHTTDPLAFLEKIHRVLVPGGHVLIQVPSADSFASVVQSSFPENVFRHMVPMDHFQLFTKKSLELSMKQTGYQIKGYWFHGLDMYELMNHLSIMHNKQVGAGTKFSQIILENLDALQQVFDEAEKSDRILIVAEKT